MRLSASEIAGYRAEQCDTMLHIRACHTADAEAFRLFGTDSISDKHVLWPRWLEIYDRIIKQVWN